MKILWTNQAVGDLARLYNFLSPASETAVARSVQSLVRAPDRLLQYPRLGYKLEEFESREVRRLLVGRYEMRYEISGEVIHILRFFHTRELR